MSYQTARTDLLTLAELKILAQARRGKAFVFIAPAELRERLESLAGRVKGA